ncbi:DUF1801 domain-containing protein [Colwellia sp. BRX10-3]|uniref:DUF1801 domain-containing protein n=1 Tax=Colwellia sp. BRX10-3 TaxID=2759844 RepID=UPI0015F6C2E4|nr:DUF1801 domain-containing protein [Colwellia sp. BRX10-3]MBA6392320.1 DUF1801 domain-containing protein [Colwellia sp. BRX10-3]
MDEITTFIAAIANETQQDDSRILLKLLADASGYAPSLQGSIIGFGQYHYKYESGREGDSAVIGFSPRKQNITIYIMPGFSNYPHLLARLGKHKVSKSCLYINKLADVDLEVLKEIASLSVKEMQSKYSCSQK